MKVSIENPKNKDIVTFLETSQETDGEYTLIEVILAPSGRNALHFHKTFAERFIATKNVLQLATAEGTLQLQPGQSFTAEPFVEHCFYNDSQKTVHFHVEIRPANEPFENFLQVAYGLINNTWTLPGGFPLNPLHLGVLYDLGDTHYRGILSWLSPVAEVLAWAARALGVKRRLIQQYCQTQRKEIP